MENKINQDLNGLMHQLENFITTKTVVGEPIHIDQTILVPLIDVSFAAATGSTASNKFVERHKEKEKRVDGGVGAGAGGLGAKVMPSAMLVIQNGTTQLINIRNQDSITKLIDMIPGLISKVPEFFGKGKQEEEVVEETVEEANVYHNMKESK
ncbi:MAG: sporulation protein [Cellulosilyticum sp.]|nr:sporulation protein [Cellulosilyticum sp.]